MHGVGPPYDGDRRRALHRRGVKGVGEREPVARRGKIVAAGPRIPAVEHRAQMIFAHILGRHAADVGLIDLPDLLFAPNAGADAPDLGLDLTGVYSGKSV